jgi:hypothetical protein
MRKETYHRRKRGRCFQQKECQEVSRFSPTCTHHRDAPGFTTGEKKEGTMTVEEHKNNDEAAIKRAIEGLRAKDLDRIVSIYAPDLVAFDLVPQCACSYSDTGYARWADLGD